ncbi:MAG: histidinol-phosphate transaminase [Bacteroidota bacterium]
MQIKNLIRENIRNLKPYTSARSLFSGDNAILLDANENGRDIFGQNLNRYPDPLQRDLKKYIADIKGVPAENIFLGNGSDEAIDLLFRIFCEPGKDEIIICPPTYGMYKVQANIHNTPIKKVLLDENFDLRPKEILKAVASTTKLLFLCSPNNPTGNLMSNDRVEYLIKNFSGIVVVDEAYIDYADSESWNQRVNEYSNLVVLQTFSKAWALAGARLGMAFASKEIIHYLNSVKFPYNINLLTQKAVLNILEQNGRPGVSFVKNLKEKKRLKSLLLQIGLVEKIYLSDANFLLVKMKNSDFIFNQLKNKKIIVRNRSKEPLCDGCLRVTIGTREENDLLINELKKMEGSLK